MPQAEAPAGPVNTEFTEDVKKSALCRGGGTVAGTGDPFGASPVLAAGPSPVSSPAPYFSPLSPERQVSMVRETESGMGLQAALEHISKWAFE